MKNKAYYLKMVITPNAKVDMEYLFIRYLMNVYLSLKI